MAFFKDNGEIWETYEKGMSEKTEKFCNDFVVQGILVDEQEQEQHLVLAYKTNLGKYESLFCRRDELAKKGLNDMRKNGFHINAERSRYFMNAVEHFEAGAKVIYIHQKLGIYNQKGMLYFLGNQSIGLPVTSRYYGQLKITPKGSLEVWLEMFRKDVVPYPETMFPFAAAFASPLVALLTQHIENQALLIALCGVSTSGKTSLLKAAISIFGAPTVDGLLGDFNDTEAYNIERLADSHGYITALDEAAMKQNLDNFCYFGSNKISKGRLDANAKRKERKTWAGTIMISCEGSALALTSGNTGIAMRMIEVTAEFTKSGEHAEKIQKICDENYGLAIEPYAKFLLDKGLEGMESDYNSCQTALELYIKGNSSGLSQEREYKRVLNRLTFILQAARYAVECFAVEEYKEDDFLQFLTSVLSSTLDYVQDQKKEPLEILKEYINLNNGHFITMSVNGTQKSPNPEGQLFRYGNRTEVKITKTCFDTLMKEHGKTPATVIKEFKKSGRLLSYQNDRNTCDITMTKNFTQAAYHILLERYSVGEPNKVSWSDSKGLDGTNEYEEAIKQRYRRERKWMNRTGLDVLLA